MKNTIKVTLAITTVAVLLFGGANNALASGAYGSDVIVETFTTEVHETVNAGLADMLPQLGIAFASVSGLLTTTLLLRKNK